MPARGSLLYQVREPLCDPAQEEAGNLHILFAEDLQQAGEVLLHVRGQCPPFRDSRGARNVQNMEPVFHVDCEDGALHRGTQVN